MSLTSHLKDPSSPIGQFIKQRFAQTTRLTKSANQRLRTADTIRPAQADTSYPYGLIGTAIDYRIRYAFDITPYQRLVAWEGAKLLTVKSFESDEDIPVDWADLASLGTMVLPSMALTTGRAQGPYPIPLILAFFNDLETVVNKMQPKGRLLELEDERTLDRYCIILSYFEQVFRSSAYLQGPLMQPTVKHSVKELFSIPQDSWINDLGEIFRRFYKQQYLLLAKSFILNPVFAGSTYVGGADADMVVDGCLIDIKTSLSPQIKAEYLYQLAGYLLLDFDDKLHIDSVGIYMARQGLLFKWSVPVFLSELTGDNKTDLSTIRREFRILCQSGWSRSTAR